jgi:hypothetical protein
MGVEDIQEMTFRLFQANDDPEDDKSQLEAGPGSVGRETTPNYPALTASRNPENPRARGIATSPNVTTPPPPE